MDEALAWITRAPFAEGDDVERRQVMSEEDSGPALSGELRAPEQRLRDRIASS